MNGPVSGCLSAETAGPDPYADPWATRQSGIDLDGLSPTLPPEASEWPGGRLLGAYSGENLGWFGVLLVIGLALGGTVIQARALTADDQIISPDSFRNPGLGRLRGPSGTAPA